MNVRSHRLLVFSDDWGRHPSSCQHLVRQLLGDVEVCWVNTIGTRRPAWNLYTLRRGFQKIRDWTEPRQPQAAEKAAQPRVLRPLMWPSFRGRAARSVNRHLLQRTIANSGFVNEDCVAVTTLPLVADLVGHLGVRRWVYYCVDDLSVWPGLDGAALAIMEDQLVSAVDRIVVVSENLARTMADRGREAELLSHGLDLDLWRQADPAAPSFVDSLQRPLIVFWGVVDRRLDLSIIAALTRDLSQGTLLFIGPENEPDPALMSYPRVKLTGPVPYEDLPNLGSKADVLIMPYADLPVTRAIQPLKLKEYLATGKPVVVTDLPAVEPWFDACDVVSSPEEFARLVLARAHHGTPESQVAARRRLTEESWKAKAQVLSTLLFD